MPSHFPTLTKPVPSRNKGPVIVISDGSEPDDDRDRSVSKDVNANAKEVAPTGLDPPSIIPDSVRELLRDPTYDQRAFLMLFRFTTSLTWSATPSRIYPRTCKVYQRGGSPFSQVSLLREGAFTLLRGKHKSTARCPRLPTCHHLSHIFHLSPRSPNQQPKRGRKNLHSRNGRTQTAAPRGSLSLAFYHGESANHGAL